jgi:ABC-2 type transport system ATP-binding protein
MPDIPMQDISTALSKAGWPPDMVKEYIKSRKPRTEGPSAVHAVNISKGVLKKVNLKVRPGIIMGITGLADSGSSELLSILAGITRPDDGTVHISGKAVGFVPKEPALLPALTVKENIQHWARVTHSKSKIVTLLNLGNLKQIANERVESLSLGIQKKVDIICSIAHDPSVLFIDEPIHGVEPSLQSEIWSLIKSLQKHRTIVIASHPCRELESVCTNITIMSKGNIVQTGAPKEYSKTSKNIYLVNIELSGHTSELAKRLSRYKSKYVHGKCVVATKSPLTILRVAAMFAKRKKERITKAEIHLPGSEDVLGALA